MRLSDSQNFINNQKLVDRIMSLINFEKDMMVLEIGPGKGIITDSLLRFSSKIVSVEADRDLYLTLARKYNGNNKIKLIHGDFLKTPLPKEDFMVVSNIPFNITANIIRKITVKDSKLRSAYLIVQKEAAIKFVGAPYAHSPLLSHFLKINYEIERLVDIDRQNFTPIPAFDATLLMIRKHDTPAIIEQDQEKFKDLLTYIFQRYKDKLRPALKSLMSNLQIKIMCHSIGIEQDIEIKKITFVTWVKIFETFKTHASIKSQNTIAGKYIDLIKEQSNLTKVNRTRKDFIKS